MKPEMWQEPPIPTTDEQSFQNILAFVSELTCDISNPQFFPPITSHQTEEKWARKMEITGRSLGMFAENRELAERYGLSLAGARDAVKNSIKRMHESSPVELQKNHPRATFNFRHPHPQLGEFEIDLPITAEPNNAEIEWFNSLTYFQAHALSNIGDPRVYSLPRIMRDAGIDVGTHSNTQIGIFLREKGISVRRLTSPNTQRQKGKDYPIRRFFVHGDHYTLAVEALMNDPDFEKLRLRTNGGDK